MIERSIYIEPKTLIFRDPIEKPQFPEKSPRQAILIQTVTQIEGRNTNILASLVPDLRSIDIFFYRTLPEGGQIYFTVTPRQTNNESIVCTYKPGESLATEKEAVLISNDLLFAEGYYLRDELEPIK